MKKQVFFAILTGLSIFTNAQDHAKNDLPDPNSGYFQDVTTSAGIGALGFRATAWGDINNDGYLDLLTSGKLFLNNKNGTFTDIAASAGITAPWYVSTFIDMNNDGKDDILYLNTNPADNVVYLNNGDNTFTAVPLTMGTPPYIFISTLSVADVNNDKYPDLFVGQLRDVNNGDAPLKNYLYINNKNNGFTYQDIYPPNMGSSSAIPDSTKWETRASMFTDYDMDGDLDLYVAIYRQEQDQLWRNDGTGHFTNMLKSTNGYIDYIPAPVDWSDHGTGCDWADYDNDGDMDLLLSNFAHPVNYNSYGFGTTTIWRNDGHTETTFTNMKSTDGIAYKESYAGAAWGDVNSDGLPDIYITCFAWYASCIMSEMYIQNANHSFTKTTSSYGLNIAKGEADGSFVDYDNDGKLDLATGESSFNFALFKNTLSSGNNWLELGLTSTSGNAMAIGAKVEVTAGGKTYTQCQIPNHGALQCKGNRLYFGLGTATTISSVQVTWPNGTMTKETFTGMSVNGIYTLTEGSATAVNAVNDALNTPRVFPNPSTSEVNFNYSLEENGPVTIELFSTLGQRTVLANNLLQNKGEHTFKWKVDPEFFVQGVYVYKMNIGERTLTGKLIISR